MKFLFLVTLPFILLGCGNSPQENHYYKNNEKVTSGVEATKSFSKLDYSAEIKWTNGPLGDPAISSSFLILLKDGEGKLADLDSKYSLVVSGWMPSMGHGTDYDGDTLRLSTGIYHHTDLYFNMSGDWEVYLDIYEGTTLVDTLVVTLFL